MEIRKKVIEPFTAKQSSIISKRQQVELLSFVPNRLPRSKHPLKGYNINKEIDIFSSNLIAGEIISIEPSVLELNFWEKITEWINEEFDLKKRPVVAIRTQLNCIFEQAVFHPLSISPHADCVSNNVDVVAINIPLQCTMPFTTSFWSHSIWGKSLLSDIYNHSTANNKANDKCLESPFSEAELVKIVNDNPTYTNSESMVLDNWTHIKNVDTRVCSATAYNGRHFHSPFLYASSKTNKSTMRISLVIFLLYKAIVKHPILRNMDLNERIYIHTLITRSMKIYNGNYSTYEVIM